MKHTYKKYGWRKDHPEIRDIKYSATAPIEIPNKIDLRPFCPPVLNQGQLGSCTAHAIANAHLFEQMKQKSSNIFLPSRLFIYYNERTINNTVNADSGAALRDGIKTINTQGVCQETMWPYDITKFARKPSMNCYSEATKHKAVSYQRVDQTLDSTKHCLASGYPFVLGFTVYSGFESEEVAKTGNGNMPTTKEECLGGHAVLAVGYDDETQRFLIMNSWGDSWGQQGFFTLPYEYLCNPSLAADFWTVILIGQ